ncbi:hypothetical protein K438DRAFT_1874984, partial [Mycena galopus ATCC 62051]
RKAGTKAGGRRAAPTPSRKSRPMAPLPDVSLSYARLIEPTCRRIHQSHPLWRLLRAGAHVFVGAEGI